MMQQYLAIKQEYQDALLLFRMGDFFELFFEDAQIAAPILEVVLTARGKHLADEIPMCGVPVHAAELYTAKLVKAGHKVAICEQLESPQEAKKRGAKAVVKREVVRVITAGTILEESLLSSATEAQNLVSIHIDKKSCYICICDLSTGHSSFLPSTLEKLESDVSRFSPKEIIIADKSYAMDGLRDPLKNFKSILSFRADHIFTKRKALMILANNFQNTLSLQAPLPDGATIAFGAIVEYATYALKNSIPNISYPRTLEPKKYMDIDASTIRNLEIFGSNNQNNKNLFQLINKTHTPMGGRLLFFHFNHPLIDKSAIESRLSSVDCLIQNTLLNQTICTLIKKSF